MEILMLEATEDSPYVLMDYQQCKVIIKGRSFMEDTLPFQEAIIDWLRTHISFSKRPLAVELELEYINSSSHQMFLFFIAELNKYYIFGQQITITWSFFSEDENMKDLINDCQQIFEVPIREYALA